MSYIDVVIPNYNYARYLRDSVESVLSQGIAELRILIIDNASTDDSAEVARSLARLDSRVQLVLRPKNLGLQATFNEGITWAASKYLLMLCSDDILAPGCLRHAASFLDAHPELVFAHGREQPYFTGQPLPWGSQPQAAPRYVIESSRAFLEARCAAELFCAGTVLARTSVQKEAGLYDPRLTYADDLEMALRLSSYGPVAKTTALHGVWRNHGLNARQVVEADRIYELREWFAAFDVHFKGRGALEADHARLLAVVKRRLGAQAFRWAIQALAKRDVARARKLTLASLRYAPEAPLFAPVAPVQKYLRRFYD